MGACSSGCGYCGRCTSGPRPEPHVYPKASACAMCGGWLGLARVTVGGVGPVCSAACVDAAVNLSTQLEVRR